MQNLGRVLISLMLMIASAWASLSVTVDNNKVVQGDSVTLTLRAVGSDVEKPKLNRICDEKIASSSHGTNIQAINGSFSKSSVFSYVFTPTKDCTIKPITMKIDGKEEVSKAIDIRVVPMKITKNSPFILEMTTDKQSVYVGEPFKVTVIFKQRKNSEAVDSKFLPPEMQNFWIKEEVKGRRFDEGAYSVSRLSFIMAAQRRGVHTVSPAQIKIATRSHSRDSWGQWLPALKWRTYFSNKLDLQVLPLPQGVDLVGDFAITAQADKRELEANEAVNVTVEISGSGNFEDIGSLKPSIHGVTAYEEEGETKTYLENGIYKGSWTQKLAFVGDGSFTIPPFTLRYFDPKSKSVKSIQTEVIPVTVKNSQIKVDEPLKIKRPEPEEISAADRQDVAVMPWKTPFTLGLFLGLLLGVSAILIPWRRWFDREGETSKVNVNDHKQVLMLLMQHQDDPESAAMVEKIEASLYEGKEVIIDKKELKALVKRVTEKV